MMNVVCQGVAYANTSLLKDVLHLSIYSTWREGRCVRVCRREGRVRLHALRCTYTTSAVCREGKRKERFLCCLTDLETGRFFSIRSHRFPEACLGRVFLRLSGDGIRFFTFLSVFYPRKVLQGFVWLHLGLLLRGPSASRGGQSRPA